MNLKNKINTFPKTPGIYMMKDKNGDVIYVGKSKRLQDRIKSYFVNSKSHSRKTQRMVKGIYDNEIITTDTELEALLLECEMIKKIKPTYNRLLKNFENYIYLKIDTEPKYPYIEVAKEINDDKFYFGPYTVGNKIYEAKEIIENIYKIRSCKKMDKCIKYDLNKCLGPCRELIGEKNYKIIMNDIISDLKGETQNVLEVLEKHMKNEINKLNFEEASKIKKNIDIIKRVINNQKVINKSVQQGNILAWIKMNENNYKVYIINHGKLIKCKTLNINFFENLNKKEYFFENINLIENEEIKNAKLINKYDIDFINIIYSYIKNNSEIKYIVF